MEWINVKDRLPEAGKEIIFTDGEYVAVGYMLDKSGRIWRDWGSSTWKPTHWMPLPDPPKEQ